MTTIGTVRCSSRDDGWGVIDSSETPMGCWVHFSNLHTAGYKDLAPGERVNLEWELARQDGYQFRAVRVWPAGTLPIEPSVITAPAAAYTSTLRITFDEVENVANRPDGAPHP